MRRINHLEKQVVADNPNPEETFLSIHNEAEQALHERAAELGEFYTNSCSVTLEDLFNAEIPLLTRCDMAKAELDKMKPQDLAIINKSHDLIDRRILDLFIQNHRQV